MDTCLRFADRKKSSEENDNENKEELSHKWIGSHFWTKHIRAYSRAFVPFRRSLPVTSRLAGAIRSAGGRPLKEEEAIIRVPCDSNNRRSNLRGS